MTKLLKIKNDMFFETVKTITNFITDEKFTKINEQVGFKCCGYDINDFKDALSHKGDVVFCCAEVLKENNSKENIKFAMTNAINDIFDKNKEIKNAKSLIVNITSNQEIDLFPFIHASNRISEKANPNTKIIELATKDKEIGKVIRISIIATGINKGE